MTVPKHSRRIFVSNAALSGAALGLSGILESRRAPAFVSSDKARPLSKWGLQIGDVDDRSATIWSRADRESTMFVEWSLDERFRNARSAGVAFVSADSGFTGRLLLRGLPADACVFVRVMFDDGGRRRARSEPIYGKFRTAPRRARPVRFVWGGDTAGQGWGIDLDKGGMTVYETMRLAEPDFFIHSGDNIYADGAMVPEVTDASGQVIWKNAYLDEIPAKLKVAETLDEFRGNYLYNRMDDNLRRFTAEVPQIWQWDDHETVNNWSPSKVLDSRYTIVTDIATLSKNSRQAFLEHSPMNFGHCDAYGRIYRKVAYGPDLDVFVLDMRSYRAANGCNVETTPGPETAYLGEEQLAWLEAGLKRSRATWKVIAADMPIGLLVGDGTDTTLGCSRWEGSSNGDGPVLGREFEIARILRSIKTSCVKNVVWLTADVHYCAAHYYDPALAQYQDFEPFWEFVAGPLHAGSFGPNRLENTFGPQVVFAKAPPAGQSNLPPSAGLQFYGQVDVDPYSKAITVSLRDPAGAAVFEKELPAA
jgi:alkaline phosphatase D